MAMLYVTFWVAPGKDKVAQNFFPAFPTPLIKFALHLYQLVHLMMHYLPLPI